MKIIKKIKSSSFFKNTLTLMTGTMLAQIMTFLASPVLSRIYQPADFGVFGLYISLTSIFAVITTGKYELAVILPKEDDDSVNIIALTVFISLVINIFIFINLFLFKDNIVILLKNDLILKYLFFIPLTIFFMGICQSLTFWNNRKKKYKRMSINQIIQSGSTASLNIGMGYVNPAQGGLIYGSVIGQFLSTLFLSYSFFREEMKLIRKINLVKIKELAIRYIEFPRTTTFSAFINVFFNNGKYLILGFVLETDILGQLLLSFRVLSIPVTIIGNAFADILFQRMSVWNSESSKNEVYERLKKILLILSGIGILPVLLLFFFGEYIISFVFGSQWSIAGKFSSYLSVSLFFQFITSPFCRAFYVIDKQRLYLAWEAIRLLVVFIPVLILGQLKFNYNLIIIVMSLSISLSYIILLFLLRKVLND